jgi:hypothetical protein
MEKPRKKYFKKYYDERKYLVKLINCRRQDCKDLGETVVKIYKLTQVKVAKRDADYRIIRRKYDKQYMQLIENIINYEKKIEIEKEKV